MKNKIEAFGMLVYHQQTEQGTTAVVEVLHDDGTSEIIATGQANLNKNDVRDQTTGHSAATARALRAASRRFACEAQARDKHMVVR